jgi:uncharacterized protein DUF2252
MRLVVRLFARAGPGRARQLSRMALLPPAGVVAIVALVCTLAVAEPRHATIASAREARLKADTTKPQVRLKADTTAAQMPPSISRLEPTDESVRLLPPQLLAQLRNDPYTYFRFVNAEWMRRTCERFDDVLPRLPAVRLHGDPHLEQYAFTNDSRGLDDFDDSTFGPFVLDMTRFLASLDLALDQRGWSAARPRASAAFFAGYRASLPDGEYLPPDPAAVTRLRAQCPREMHDFLAWVDSLMLPLDPEYEAAVPFVRATLEEYAGRVRPGMPASFFRVKKTGRLNLGVGSALASKVLFRLEGSTRSDDDDVVVEAKRSGDLTAVSCLQAADAPGAVRVVTGSEQIGRLHHQFIMVLPPYRDSGSDTPRWWLRSWEPSYREVDIADYVSADEIVEVAHDVGAQLGHGHMAARPADDRPRDASQQLRAVDQIEARIRQAVTEQTAELMEAWRRFRAR